MPASLRLPVEVLAVIVRLVDHRATLVALMPVSRPTYDLASRLLYAEIIVTERTLTSCRVGLLPWRPDPGEVAGGCPNTASDAHKRCLFALTTAIPVSRVSSVPSLEEEHPSCPLDRRTFRRFRRRGRYTCQRWCLTIARSRRDGTQDAEAPWFRAIAKPAASRQTEGGKALGIGPRIAGHRAASQRSK